MTFRTFLILPLFLILTSFASYGEGTKQLMPDSTFSEAGLYFDNTGSSYTYFGLPFCAPNYRLYIHVKNVGESILFGMQNYDNTVSYNLRKPDGTIALSGTCPSNYNQPGYIRYYKQAVTGPFPQNGGYTPLSYKVTSIADTGNYYFEMVNLSWSIILPLWDFQVVSGQHTPAIATDTINGRVWSQSWQLYAYLVPNVVFNGHFYIYSDDGIVTRLAFDNTRVGAVTIFCNPFGCLNTGDFESDRKSMNDNTFVTFPGIAQYKVFLNDPDSTVYPSGVYGEITDTPYMVPDTAYPPCSGNKIIMVEVNKAGQVEVVINLPYGGTTTTVNFFAPVVPGMNAIDWDGKDGLGNPVPDGTLIDVSVTFVNGLTNLPIWDQEQNQNGFLISLVRPVNPSVLTPLTFWDDTQLISSGWDCPVAPQASNLTGCSPGSIPGYTGCHPWGLYSEDCHNKMINTWWYGSTSVATFTDLFISSPAMPVGHGATRCGQGILMLHATVPPSVTVDWYDVAIGGSPLLTGDTTFYTPVLQNTTTFYAEARNPVTGCPGGTRVPVIATIVPAQAPSLTGPTMVCRETAGNLYITDPGKINYLWNVSPGGTVTGGYSTNAITVTWNGGGWQSVSVSYSDTSGCESATPSVIRVAVVPVPDSAGMIIGTDSVCSGTTGVSYMVEPMVVATSYTWSVPPGAIITAGMGTNAIIVDFPAGASSGILTVFATNSCGDGLPSPPFPVTVNPPPMAAAGPDATTCQNVPFVITQASASGYSRIHWYSNGTGTLSDTTSLHPQYRPGDNETGTVWLTMIAFGIHPCTNDTSAMALNVVPAPMANAGSDLTTCDSQPVTLFDPTASNYSSLQWSTSGTGTFSDPTSLHPIYTPGNPDIENGQVILSLAASGSSFCAIEMDSLMVTIEKLATANAGPDQVTCGNHAVNISSSDAKNYATLNWYTSGTGIFSDIHTLHPFYSPGIGDIAAGKVFIILNAIGKGNCPSVSDTSTITIATPPSAIAGPDKETCQNGFVMVTSASAKNFSHITWTHDGSGSLTGVNELTPVYIPSPTEAGTITLTLKVSGTGSCFADTASDQMQILVHQPVMVDAGTEITIPYGTSITLSDNVEGGSGKYNYQWEPEKLFLTPSIPNPETLPLTHSVTFQLAVVDQQTGCSGNDTINILVGEQKKTEECLVIYNVFTPNGDGSNDTWIIDCMENFPVNKVTVFDRWGDKINEFENYNNASSVWKGTNSKNEPVPDGTYYYIISIKNGGTYTGWVYVRGGNK